jgi:hypothetical protein
MRQIHPHAFLVPYLDQHLQPRAVLVLVRNEAARERVVAERQRHLLQLVVGELVRFLARDQVGRHRACGDRERRAAQQPEQQLAPDRRVRHAFGTM